MHNNRGDRGAAAHAAASATASVSPCSKRKETKTMNEPPQYDENFDPFETIEPTRDNEPDKTDRVANIAATVMTGVIFSCIALVIIGIAVKIFKMLAF